MTPEILAWLVNSWVHSEPHIQAAVDRADGTFDIYHVWDQLRTNQAQLWPGERSAVVTRIETHPSGVKSLLIWLAGGELEEVVALGDKAEAWAKANHGCTRVEVIGRRGWLRALPKYREVCTVLVKEI